MLLIETGKRILRQAARLVDRYAHDPLVGKLRERPAVVVPARRDRGGAWVERNLGRLDSTVQQDRLPLARVILH